MAVMMFSVSVGRSFSDRCETGVAHQHSVVVICVASDDEIGFIIKAALAFAAKSETVLAPFHRQSRNFITSSIVGVFVVVVTGENTLCGLGPVVSVGSSSQVHRSSHCLCVFVSGGSCHPPNIRKSISILFKSHTIHIDQEKK
jgi:hypothetical protein